MSESQSATVMAREYLERAGILEATIDAVLRLGDATAMLTALDESASCVVAVLAGEGAEGHVGISFFQQGELCAEAFVSMKHPVAEWRVADVDVSEEEFFAKVIPAIQSLQSTIGWDIRSERPASISDLH